MIRSEGDWKADAAARKADEILDILGRGIIQEEGGDSVGVYVEIHDWREAIEALRQIRKLREKGGSP